VIARLCTWLDHRTGYRRFLSVMLIEHIPGGAKWRYVWGSCLAVVFLLQLITGVLLMTAYSPGDSTAWSSVYYIQYQMDFGWFIRGLHHFGSQTMVVLLGLHMLQVVIAGAHLPPREVNWWLGLILLGLILALSLTGYLLPWDQKGYWATQVATNIAGNIPVVGQGLQKIIVGGPEYGHHTLTRFFTLHVAILPPLVILLIVLHLVVFRRHGVTAPKKAEGEGWFWPDQAFRDLLVCLVIFGVMIGLVVYGHGNKIDDWQPDGTYDRWAHAGRDGKGANLDAPANPATDYPARPEWYFLFLFQLLKYFEGSQEIIGTVVIPNGVLVLLAVLPLLTLGQKEGWCRRFAHVFGVLVVTGLLVGAGTLTCLAIAEDMLEPVPRELVRLIGLRLLPLAAVVLLVWLAVLSLLGRERFRDYVGAFGGLAVLALLGGAGYLFQAALRGEDKIPPKAVAYLEERMTEKEKERTDKAKKLHEDLEKADELAQRAVNAARDGIPAEGAGTLLARDPVTEGPKLFRQTCAVCHSYGDDPRFRHKEEENWKPKAWDLEKFGTTEWVRDLLRNPTGPRFTFQTKGESKPVPRVSKLKTMTAWVTRTRNAAEKKGQLQKLDEEFDQIAEWLGKHPRTVPKAGDASEFAKGYKAFRDRCMECHSYGGEKVETDPRAPDLTGYGDASWVRLMIMSPNSPSRYGARNGMPAFLDLEGSNAEFTLDNLKRLKEADLNEAGDDAKKKKAIEEAHTRTQLSDLERELIIRWLLNDDRIVFGGEPIGAAPKR
jgi:quinol-cytochrome oxidoreductase complex cytochrome b subunit/mono/diheme cytochrome c family protein